LNLIILDADVIITFLEIGVWDKFLNNNNVILAETVLQKEVKFYFLNGDPSKKEYIDLNSYLKHGKLQVISLDLPDLLEFEQKCREKKAPDLDLGEKETLAIAYLNKIQDDIKICLAETLAIHCAVFMDLGDKCISAEQALKDCGLPKKLKNQYSEKWFRITFKKAQADKIMHT